MTDRITTREFRAHMRGAAWSLAPITIRQPHGNRVLWRWSWSLHSPSDTGVRRNLRDAMAACVQSYRITREMGMHE